MQISDSYHSVYISLFNILNVLHTSDKNVELKFNEINKWLNERCVIHRDYDWDLFEFSLWSTVVGGYVMHPAGITFYNTNDATAFKLTFKR